VKARILERADVLKVVDLLQQQGYEVFAPFAGRGRDTWFDLVTEENRDRIQVHLPNPYYPPKRFVLPHIERLLKVHQSNGEIRIEPTYRDKKRAIFGIRSCDLAGIWHLDRFYLGREFRDLYYEKRRQNLFLVNVVCTDPERDIGEECFCPCADTGPAARDPFLRMPAVQVLEPRTRDLGRGSRFVPGFTSPVPPAGRPAPASSRAPARRACRIVGAENAPLPAGSLERTRPGVERSRCGCSGAVGEGVSLPETDRRTAGVRSTVTQEAPKS